MLADPTLMVKLSLSAQALSRSTLKGLPGHAPLLPPSTAQDIWTLVSQLKAGRWTVTVMVPSPRVAVTLLNLAGAVSGSNGPIVVLWPVPVLLKAKPLIQ